MLVAASPHRDQQRQVWSNALGVARCAYEVKAGGYRACPGHEGLKCWRDWRVERLKDARSSEVRRGGSIKVDFGLEPQVH